MSEKFTGGFENKKEDIPTKEEIVEVLPNLITGRKFEVGRELDDEQGTYLREVNIITEEDKIEYEYMRKGQHPGGMKSLTSNVSITFYDKGGIPEGGNIVARYENGKWALTV